MYTIYPSSGNFIRHLRNQHPYSIRGVNRINFASHKLKKSVNMAESSEKMPPYPDIFTDDFQMSDQVKYDILTKPWTTVPCQVGLIISIYIRNSIHENHRQNVQYMIPRFFQQGICTSLIHDMLLVIFFIQITSHKY